MDKAEICKNRRYKKPALADMSYDDIILSLSVIVEDCSDIHYALEDDETLINALDGDEDEAWEFRMLFTALESEAYQLQEELNEFLMFEDDAEQKFNDCSVALIGDRFRAVGFDDFEEDYFALTSYDANLAYTEAGKRVMRLTKAQMLSEIGHTVGIILAYHNVKAKYDNLKSTIDILKDNNTSIIQQIKEIEQAYILAEADGFWGESNKAFDNLIKDLPDLLWVQ